MCEVWKWNAEMNVQISNDFDQSQMLNHRLLLAQAMKTSKAPDDIR